MGSADLWLGIAVLRGLESGRPAGERLLDDPVSLRLLPAGWRLLLRVLGFTGLDRAILDRRERQQPGLIGSLLCRTRYIDDALRRALEEGAEQVVILGAGFDTRAWRIPGVEGASVFEVDLPEAQAAKRKALARGSVELPQSVTFVPVDFDDDDLNTALEDAGYRGSLRTFFIWEGVTQYISRSGIEDTLELVGTRSGAGSGLAFTYVRSDVIAGTQASDVERQVMAQAEEGGAPWRTGLDPGEVPDLLARHGLRMVEEVGGNEYRSRYLDPSSRRLATLRAERAVLAEVGVETRGR